MLRVQLATFLTGLLELALEVCSGCGRGVGCFYLIDIEERKKKELDARSTHSAIFQLELSRGKEKM
jgi:hypothetical protein